MSSLGSPLLFVALGAAIWAVAASALGVKRKDRGLTESGKRALFAATGLIAAATGVLWSALAAHDFSIEYVASYTSKSTPGIHTFTALWAGMEGSLLFWTLLTCLYAASAVWVQNRRRPDLTPVATAVLSGILAFLISVLVFAANPFHPASPIPLDGDGLNPLLQSPFMAIHPVLLYLGLTGFAVPFAFAAASLVVGRLDSRWFISTRRWTVVAWSFLSVGILLGAAWAYMELGWGGYWAWDPVENASLLPWLTGTAFLHSVLIQERRGMLKIWNVSLILATYCLAIFGTFLTRSGLVTSVHTFSESPVGKMFLPMLAVLLLASFSLLAWRFDNLRSTRQLESMASREAMFLFNNLLFVAIAFTVLWGTIYPVIVEAFSGKKISVGPAFFNSVVTPIGLALFGLAGVGPLVAWRRDSGKSLWRRLALPFGAGSATVAGLAAGGTRSAGALFGMGLCSFVAASTIGEFISGARAHRRPGAAGLIKGLLAAVGRNRRRYGGYVVHLGVVLIFLGLAGSSFKQTWSGQLVPGDRFTFGGYSIEYLRARNFATEEKMVNMAVVSAAQDPGRPFLLRPQRNFHLAQRQPQSEIALRTGLSHDLYLVLTDMEVSGRITLRAWINPLVAWIWIGGAVMAAGMLIILSAKPPPPPLSRVRAAAAHPEKVAATA